MNIWDLHSIPLNAICSYAQSDQESVMRKKAEAPLVVNIFGHIK